jgi:DNA polymerase-3 subunit beta
MRLVLERTDALSSLSRVTGVVSRNANIPILNNVVVTAKDGRVFWRATDLDMEATASCSADIETDGETTVDANKLREVFASAAQGSQISLDLTDDADPRLVVKSGRSRFKLPVLDAGDFPVTATDEYQATFDVPAEILLDMLTRTVFAVGSDMAMPALHGVALEIEDKSLIAVATNRYRVSRITQTAPKGSAKMPGVIIPTKYVGQIIKALSGATDATVSVSKNKVRVVAAGVTLIGKTVDYEYVDYRRLLPSEHENTAKVGREAFSAAARRAAIAGDTDKNGTGIRLAFSSGLLTITGRNPDGEALDEIEVEYEGPEIAIGAGFQYVLDALANVEGDVVTIAFGEKAPVIVLWSETDDASLQVVGKRMVAR